MSGCRNSEWRENRIEISSGIERGSEKLCKNWVCRVLRFGGVGAENRGHGDDGKCVVNVGSPKLSLRGASGSKCGFAGH